LFQAIKKMKDAVQQKFDEKVVPVISALMAPIAEKLMPKISIPLIKAQKDLIEEFCKHHKDVNRGSWHLYWDLRKRENTAGKSTPAYTTGQASQRNGLQVSLALSGRGLPALPGWPVNLRRTESTMK